MAHGLGSRTELVFTRSDGSQLQPQRVSRAFQSLARRAELPLIRLHDHYAETGQVPKRFMIGGTGGEQRQYVRAPTARPVVIPPPSFIQS